MKPRRTYQSPRRRSAPRASGIAALAEALRPFAGEEERLTWSMLRSVAEEVRVVAKRPVPAPVIEAAAGPRRRRLTAAAIGSVTAAALAAIVVSRGRPGLPGELPTERSPIGISTELPDLPPTAATSQASSAANADPTASAAPRASASARRAS